MPAEEALPEHPEAPDLLRGGLLYKVMRRFGVDPEQAARTARRAVLLGFLLWAPMAVLALLDGHALPGKIALPFFFDVAAYVRPLVVIPLLLAAEPVLATAWKLAGHRFHDRGLVGPEARDAYDALVARVTRSAQAKLPDLVCLGLAAAACAHLASVVVGAPRDTWFATTVDATSARLTYAGGWALFVHGVLFFLSLRWVWRMVFWYRFLWGTARLPLHLLPIHPDRAAGLGFLGRTIAATTPLALAWSAGLACAVANRMLHQGERLLEFVPVGVGMLVLVLVLFVLPLALLFAPLLVRTRRDALEDIGRRMARTGDRVRGEPASHGLEAAPGADPGNAPGLEDLEIAVAAVRGILPIPFALSHVIPPLLGAAAPAVVLLFLAFPAREVFQKMLDLVF